MHAGRESVGAIEFKDKPISSSALGPIDHVTPGVFNDTSIASSGETPLKLNFIGTNVDRSNIAPP
jgi:hypothetical protein